MLRLGHDAYLRIVAHVLDGLPLEACGLLAGTVAGTVGDGSGGDGSGGDGVVAEVYPCRNAAESAKVYEVDSLDYLHADRDADSRGLRITGVYHSHTHTDAYPSPTDVGQAPDPTWHYVVVSLRAAEPVMRSFRIVDGAVSEEPVALDPR